MTSTEKLLRALVALPSVNPAFLPEGHKHAGEQSIAEFLATVGARAGLDVELQAVQPGRPNLIARLEPRGPARRRILLAPHLDTVPAAEEHQYTPVAKMGRLHGRGACDTKGSVAAMFSAMCELAHGDRRPAGTEIVFAGLIDEESCQAGSRAVVASGLKADLAIIGEPTKLAVVTAHKGNLWIRVETQGKSAHGATPHLGRNAIHSMAAIVEAFETDYRQRLSKRKHPLLGMATSNVGVIRGGAQANIVPAGCVIEIDRRTLPGESDAEVRREVASLLKRHKLRAEFSFLKPVPCLPMETSLGLPLVRQFMKSVGQTRPVGAQYYCDASVFSAGGTPSVVFGPGDIAQAHTHDEWIELDQLERARRILVEFLHSLP